MIQLKVFMMLLALFILDASNFGLARAQDRSLVTVKAVNQNMPNQDTDDDLLDDGLTDERLNTTDKNREFKDAQDANSDIFSSFTDDTDPNKLELLDDSATVGGSTTQSSTASSSNNAPIIASNQLAPHLTSDVFQSFSEGLPGVEKFQLVSSDQIISLDDFFRSPSCPVTEYYTGKPVKGQPYSRILEKLVARVCDVPWYKNIKVRFTAGDVPTEYSIDTDTMVLNPTLSKSRQILDFAHQAYHATNRLQFHIYMAKEGMLSRDAYIDLYLWAEVGALLTEVDIRRQLVISDDYEPVVQCRNDDGTLSGINAERWIEAKADAQGVVGAAGLSGLHKKLWKSMVRGSRQLSSVTVLDALYKQYTSTYDYKKALMPDLIEQCHKKGMPDDNI